MPALVVQYRRSAMMCLAGLEGKDTQAMTALELEIPDDLYTVFGGTEMRALAREALIVRLYMLGTIGSGRASQLLGVTRRSFLLDILGKYGQSHFDENIDLGSEAAVF